MGTDAKVQKPGNRDRKRLLLPGENSLYGILRVHVPDTQKGVIHDFHRIVPGLAAAQQLLQQSVIRSHQMPGGLLQAHRVHQRQQPPGIDAAGEELADRDNNSADKPLLLPIRWPPGGFQSLTQAGEGLLQTGLGQDLPPQTLGDQRVHGIAAVVPFQPAAVGQCGQIPFQRLPLRADSREEGGQGFRAVAVVGQQCEQLHQLPAGLGDMADGIELGIDLPDPNRPVILDPAQCQPLSPQTLPQLPHRPVFAPGCLRHQAQGQGVTEPRLPQQRIQLCPILPGQGRAVIIPENQGAGSRRGHSQFINRKTLQLCPAGAEDHGAGKLRQAKQIGVGIRSVCHVVHQQKELTLPGFLFQPVQNAAKAFLPVLLAQLREGPDQAFRQVRVIGHDSQLIHKQLLPAPVDELSEHLCFAHAANAGEQAFSSGGGNLPQVKEGFLPAEEAILGQRAVLEQTDMGRQHADRAAAAALLPAVPLPHRLDAKGRVTEHRHGRIVHPLSGSPVEGHHRQQICPVKQGPLGAAAFDPFRRPEDIPELVHDRRFHKGVLLQAVQKPLGTVQKRLPVILPALQEIPKAADLVQHCFPGDLRSQLPGIFVVIL